MFIYKIIKNKFYITNYSQIIRPQGFSFQKLS